LTGMTWQNFAEAAVTRYVPDAAVRELVLAEIRGEQRSPDLRVRAHEITFEAVGEGRLPELFTRRWPAYRRWYEQDGDRARPSLEQAVAALEQHMPELVPIWSALVAATGADELGARMLTLYDPPPLLSGCSQAALPGEAALVRNYDYDPNLFDAVVLQTQFTDTRVIGMADQLWGLLDGVNDRGLAVSITFGGRREIGEGFGIPLVVRYLLETCGDVDEASAAIGRLPVHMAYNVTMVDLAGRTATAFVGPGRQAEVRPLEVITNHQDPVMWEEYARATRTLEREQHLSAMVADGGIAEHRLVDAFLEPPLYARGFDRGFGTLYTAVYRPAEGIVDFRWPGSTWRQAFAAFVEGEHTVPLIPDA